MEAELWNPWEALQVPTYIREWISIEKHNEELSASSNVVNTLNAFHSGGRCCGSSFNFRGEEPTSASLDDAVVPLVARVGVPKSLFPPYFAIA